MATNRPRAYMCACCFIDLVKHSVGKPLEAGRANDIWYIEQLIQAHFETEIEVFTSTLTIAECTHVGDENITPEVRSLFVRFLTSGQYLTLIEPDAFVAEDARDLRWKHHISLSGADGLHIASALSVECKEFLTSDTRRKGPIHQASKIAPLGMAVIRPFQTGFLSDERRQTAMPGMPQSATTTTASSTRGKRKRP